MRKRVYLLVALGLYVLPSLAKADDWVGGASPDWFLDGNWNDMSAPTGADNVLISTGTTFLNDPLIGSVGAVSQDIFIGDGVGQSGSLTISGGGTLSSDDAIIGHDSATGSVLLQGAGSSWTLTGDLAVGAADGIGTLIVQNGATLQSDNTTLGFANSDVGFPGGTADVTITGSGTIWNTDHSFILGASNSDVTLQISDGAEVNIGEALFSDGTDNNLSLIISGGSTVTVGTAFVFSMSDSGGAVETAEALITGAGTTLTVDNPAGGITVGGTGTSILSIEDGATVHSSYGQIGSNGSGGGLGGFVYVRDAGSSWTLDTLNISDFFQSGELHIENGAAVNSVTANIAAGLFSVSGSVTVSGVGSVWNNTGNASFGDDQAFFGGVAGTLIVEDAAAADIGGDLYVAQNLGSGNISVTSGGTLNDTNAFLGYGGAAGANVSGAGSLWASSATLSIGSAALAISDGGMVTNVDGYIGAGTTGSAYVGDADSVWASSGTLYIGDNGGAGLLELSDGGLVSAASIVAGHLGGTATLNILGGQLTATDGQITTDTGTGVINFAPVPANYIFGLDIIGDFSLNVSAGTTNLTGDSTYSGTTIITGGGLSLVAGGTVNSGEVDIAVTLGTTGDLMITGAGSVWTSSDDLNLANNNITNTGTGTLMISAGGVMNNVNGFIGIDGSGTATVTGAGSEWNNSGDLTVGGLGATSVAHLTIAAGGLVTADDSIIGTNSPDSLVTVTGAGSALTLNGDLTIGNFTGTGTLIISNGGVVTAGNALVGVDTVLNVLGGTGDVTVTGTGSTWTLSGDLVIGDNAGTGILTIADGGVVNSATAKIGRGAGTTAHVDVSGAGSEWNVIGDFYVGTLLDDADFTVENGAVVTAGGNAFIGDSAVGTALVTDAGSEWNIGNDLIIGTNEGVGTLTLSSFGRISADGVILGDIDTDSIGTLNIGSAPADAAVGPGTLDVPTITTGAGSGTINFKHTSASYDVDAAISSNIGVNQRAGTTILNANNTYTGVTSVLGGRLIVDGSITSDSAVSAGATLGGTGTVANVVSSGIIAPGAITTPATFTIQGTYLGNAGSELHLNTELGLDASPTDLLVFDGGGATGATEVFITNAGGVGGYSTTDGIRVIQAINGATIQAGMFTLGTSVQVGIYDYDIVEGGDDISEQYDYFLRAVNLSTNVPVYAATPELIMSYVRETLGTVHDRMDLGEEVKVQHRMGFMGANAGLADIAAMEGAWVRAFGGQRKFESGDLANSGYKADFGGVQVGKDIYRAEHINGSADHVGLYLAQGKVQADMTSVNGNVGKTNFDATTSGAYWTHFATKNAYASINAQYSRIHKLEVTPTGGNGINPGGDNVAVAVEVGKKIKSVKDITIEPQAQVIYQYLKLADDNDGVNNINFDPQNSVTSRLGVRLSRTTETESGLAMQPWSRVNLLHTVEQKSRITMGTDTFDTPIGGTQGEAQIGLSVGRPFKSGDAGWSLYMNAGYLAAISQSPSTDGWTVSSGVKWMW